MFWTIKIIMIIKSEVGDFLNSEINHCPCLVTLTSSTDKGIHTLYSFTNMTSTGYYSELNPRLITTVCNRAEIWAGSLQRMQ